MTAALLSKSRYITSLQCFRRLWPQLNEPEGDTMPAERLSMRKVREVLRVKLSTAGYLAVRFICNTTFYCNESKGLLYLMRDRVAGQRLFTPNLPNLHRAVVHNTFPMPNHI